MPHLDRFVENLNILSTKHSVFDETLTLLLYCSIVVYQFHLISEVFNFKNVLLLSYIHVQRYFDIHVQVE